MNPLLYSSSRVAEFFSHSYRLDESHEMNKIRSSSIYKLGTCSFVPIVLTNSQGRVSSSPGNEHSDWMAFETGKDVEIEERIAETRAKMETVVYPS